MGVAVAGAGAGCGGSGIDAVCGRVMGRSRRGGIGKAGVVRRGRMGWDGMG